MSLTFTLVVGAIALLVAAEATARWKVRRSRCYTYTPGSKRHMRPDPVVHPQLESLVRIEVNRDGERGGEILPGSDAYRVLVMGGSAAECFLNDQGTSWPGVVESVLSEKENLTALGAPRAHVGNIGRSGVCTGALLRMAEAVLPDYEKLDAIVVMVGASDILRWIEIGAPADRPVEPLGMSQLFAEHRYVRLGWHPRTLGITELVRRLRTRSEAKFQMQDKAASWMGRARAQRWAARPFLTDRPDPEAALRALEANLAKAIELAREKARTVVIVRQPWFDKAEYTDEEEALFWNGSVGSAFKGEASGYYGTATLFELTAMMDARVAAVADRLGVRHVDLRPSIEMSARSFYDHYHLTVAACAVVGRIVAEAVVEEAGRGRPRSAQPRG